MSNSIKYLLRVYFLTGHTATNFFTDMTGWLAFFNHQTQPTIITCNFSFPDHSIAYYRSRKMSDNISTSQALISSLMSGLEEETQDAMKKEVKLVNDTLSGLVHCSFNFVCFWRSKLFFFFILIENVSRYFFFVSCINKPRPS